MNYACGCWVDCYEEMNWCRVHKAAPELLRALENLVGAVTIKSPDIDKNIQDAYIAIKLALPPQELKMGALQ